jgi:hypothetical protein
VQADNALSQPSPLNCETKTRRNETRDMNAGPDFAERVEPNQRKFRSELVFGGSLTLNAARDGRPAVLVPYRGAWCPRWIVAASC